MSKSTIEEITSVSGLSVDAQKSLGAFYTPPTLADYMAKELFSLCPSCTCNTTTILDPAVGEGALLLACYHVSSSKDSKIKVIGIDVNDVAIKHSKTRFQGLNCESKFVTTDALLPYNAQTPQEGWSILKKKCSSEGFDMIISNPPWGADKSLFANSSSHYSSAIGQYDIYDLFVESIIENLNNNGCYGIIVPDSIIGKEHQRVRQLLLTRTSVTKIVRLGEGIFPNINTAVTLVFGTKLVPENSYQIKCAHLPYKLQKEVISEDIALDKAIVSCTHMVPYSMMVEHGYSFITDVEQTDKELCDHLRASSSLSTFVYNRRGIELSKKGIVLKCTKCNNWFPRPNGKSDIVCPHCKTNLFIDNIPQKKIIDSHKANSNWKPIIVGEDVDRFKTKSKSYILTSINGINYKNITFYEKPKILVRKTGVGITAGIDYHSCYTNQVVYMLTRRPEINPAITEEVILAVLNSRIMTYYIIKNFGKNGWTSNAYMTQSNINELPFPKITLDENNTLILSRITQIIRQYVLVQNKDIPAKVDAELEYLVAKLFGISEDAYQLIFSAISNVQQMIPFKRLLNITIKDIFRYGI